MFDPGHSKSSITSFNAADCAVFTCQGALQENLSIGRKKRQQTDNIHASSTWVCTLTANEIGRLPSSSMMYSRGMVSGIRVRISAFMHELFASINLKNITDQLMHASTQGLEMKELRMCSLATSSTVGI
jgi:hypothetical protein